MNSRKSPLSYVALLPYILFMIATLGFSLALGVSGIEFAIRSLIYVIPIILAAIVLLFKTQKACPNCGRHTLITEDFVCHWCGYPLISEAYNRIDKSYKQLQDEKKLGKGPSEPEPEEGPELELEYRSGLCVNGLSFIHLVLFTVLLFIISIIILLSFPTRPWAYFVIVALMSGLIFVQIIYQRQKWTDNLIIFEIILVSLNLIWGVVLKYPLYFGATDILGHLSGIEAILQTADITGLETYINFPLFHIYNAIGIEITDFSLRTGLFVFMGIAWEVGILFTYLLFIKISHSRKFSLTACLLYAMSAPVIVYGSYAITRALAFVIILCWLYLILNKSDFKYVFLSLITIFALVLTHHTTIIFFIPILIVVYISQKLFPGDRTGEFEIPLVPIMALAVVFYAYIFYIINPFTSSMIQQNFAAVIGLDSQPDLAQTLSRYTMGDIFDSLILFFFIIGIAIAIKQYVTGKKKSSFAIVLPSLIFLLFYFPIITRLIPDSNKLLLYRLPILVSPFIIYIVAYGLIYLIRFGRNLKVYLPVTVISVIMITFFSMITPANGGDVNYIQHSADVGSTFFTKSELTAFSFISREGNYESFLYGDYETVRNKYDLPTSTFPNKGVITGGDVSYISEGYLILRTGELQKTGGLNFSFEGSLDVYYRYHLSQSDPSSDIFNSLSVKDCVYSNSDVQLFVINN